MDQNTQYKVNELINYQRTKEFQEEQLNEKNLRLESLQNYLDELKAKEARGEPLPDLVRNYQYEMKSTYQKMNELNIEIMCHKWRIDEINTKLQNLRK